jgi:hypothetical protein
MQLFATLVPEDFRGASTNRWSVFTSAPLSCVGTALTLSLLVVYLHNVRRVSITFATILLALTAIADSQLARSRARWSTGSDRWPSSFRCSWVKRAP